MISPTVARMLHYFPTTEERERADIGEGPLAAVLAAVIDERTVNIGVFNRGGRVFGRENVTLQQDGDAAPEGGGYCAWMAYQKGQAAKTEQLEKDIASNGLYHWLDRTKRAIGDMIPGKGTPNASLLAAEQMAAEVAVAPRVKLEDIEGAIAATYTLTADKAIGADVPAHASLNILTLCFVVMKNGFTVIGKSAPASAENFNPDLGRKFAYEDAIRQLWPLMGYALRDRLAAQPAA